MQIKCLLQPLPTPHKITNSSKIQVIVTDISLLLAKRRIVKFYLIQNCLNFVVLSLLLVSSYAKIATYGFSPLREGQFGLNLVE